MSAATRIDLKETMLPIFQFLFAVGLSFVFQKSQPTDARNFALDNLGNLYLIHDSYIERFNSVGNGKFRSSDLNYGNIEYFDYTNPLKPFIYYRGSGKLVTFDNTLSEQGTSIDLFDKDYEQVELLCGSRGDYFWMWDSRNSEMIRVDANFQKISSTGNLSVLLGKEFQPAQMLERGKHVYLRDPKWGILVFDIYGTYETTLNILPAKDIQIMNDEVIYSDGQFLYVLGSDWLTEQKMELPVANPDRVFYHNQNLYCLKDGFLTTWKYSETTRN